MVTAKGEIEMIHFVTDDIFLSPADALVNTVNCEGYMGKGLAYQFKLRYPKNNIDYIKACKTGKLTIGHLHCYRELEKLIINFPTKDKWRTPSKLEYIIKGLDDLRRIIIEKRLKSIAIPPLGSGNGGLNWLEVKSIIVEKLSSLTDVDIYIHEPGVTSVVIPKSKPKVSLAALILVYIKLNLNSKIFKPLVPQKTAFFMDAKLINPYFRFNAYKNGPYDDSIRIISRNILEYKNFYNIKSTKKLFDSINSEIISEKTIKKCNELKPALDKSIYFMNKVADIHQIECVATILYIVREQRGATESEIIEGFVKWSVDKCNRFPVSDILDGIQLLIEEDYIEETLMGYSCKNIF